MEIYLNGILSSGGRARLDKLTYSLGKWTMSADSPLGEELDLHQRLEKWIFAHIFIRELFF